MSKQRLLRIFYVLIVYILLELGARQYLSPFKLQNPDFIGRPQAASTQWSAANTVPVGALWYWKDDALYPHDYHSSTINFVDGYRVTVGTPAQWGSTIYLIGSSAMTGADVADNETIASQIQNRVPEERVINVGMHGGTAVTGLARLKTLDILAGDTVVFYFGGIEGYAVWDTANLDRGSRLTDGLCNMLLRLPSSLTQLLCWHTLYDPPGLHDERLRTYADAVFQIYKSAVEQAAAFTTERGARFINVLAPYCGCSTQNEYPGNTIAYSAFYGLARTMPDSVDFGQLIPDRMFFQTTHTGAEGNAIIATKLAELVRIKVNG